jgi:two-component system NtrC family sensor kinase
MAEASRPQERPARSIRFRLLAIALLPTLVILPLLLGIAIARWNAKFDALLITKVNGDLTIAHQYLSRILENTGEHIQAIARVDR